MKFLGTYLGLLMLLFAPASAAEDQLVLLKQRGTGGDLQVQITLGQMFAFGIGVPIDFDEASRWSKLAADQGSPEAMLTLGNVVSMKSNGASYAYKQVAALYEQARERALERARSGDPAAQYVVAFVDTDKNLGPPKMPPSETLFRQSSGQGYLLSELELIRSSITKNQADYSSYLPLAMKAAQRGSSEAMMRVGFIYRNYLHDRNTAKVWFVRAAELNELASTRVLCAEYGIRVGSNPALGNLDCNPFQGLSDLSTEQKLGLGVVALGAFLALLPPETPQEREDARRNNERRKAVSECYSMRALYERYRWIDCESQR